MQLLHPRSEGTIQDRKYIKKSNHSLEDEALELDRCMRLSLHTCHILSARLLKYNSEENLLSTEHIVGEGFFNFIWNNTNIFKYIFNKSKYRDMLLCRIEEIGSWLSKYHFSELYSEHRSSANIWLSDSFKRKIDSAYNKNLIDQYITENLYELQIKILNIMENSTYLKICKIHGDFISYNMIRDSLYNIHIIDFADTRIGFNIEDVVRFWEHMWAMSQTNTWRASFLSEACEAFLTGYGLKNTVIEEESFTALRIYNAVTNLLSLDFSRKFLSYASYSATRRITNSSMQWVRKVLSSSAMISLHEPHHAAG